MSRSPRARLKTNIHPAKTFLHCAASVRTHTHRVLPRIRNASGYWMEPLRNPVTSRAVIGPVKIASILGGCMPLDSTSYYHKQRCDAAIAPGKPLNRLGWSVLHVVNDIFFPGTIAWEYLPQEAAGGV